jgi:hypothetical protein
MLTIRNISKIVEKSIYIGGNALAIGKIYDVYDWIDNRYEFIVEITTPKDTKLYRLFLNREKIPYHTFTNVTPQVLHDGWELSYEEGTNQIIVEALDKKDLKDMGNVVKRIENIVERILK